MARKRREAEHESHERWLVSYADFITLLFAFFVVMFASSHADKAKAKAVSHSVTQAFDDAATLRKITNALRGRADAEQSKRVTTLSVPAPPAERSDELLKSSAALVQALRPEIESGKISVAMVSRGLVISLQQAAFFPSGGDTLLGDALPSMDKIAKVIGKLPNQIRLEGHTDSNPISNARFRNNWELSSARGIAVLQWLQSHYGFPTSKLAVVAYADTVPKTSNDTEEGRALNRRVDVTVLNDDAAKQEATAASSGGKNATEAASPQT